MATTDGAKSKLNSLYKELSGDGKIESSMSIIVGSVLFVLSILLGFYLISTDKDEEYLRIKGTIVNSECTNTGRVYNKMMGSRNKYKCSVNIKYNVDNKEYYKTLIIDGETSVYVKNEPMDIMVLKKDHNNVKVAELSKTKLGVISMVAGIVILVGGYIHYYLTERSKTN